MKGIIKAAAALAALFAVTGAQAADLGGPVGGYKDDVVYSWWNAGDIFVRLRGEAVSPAVSNGGGVTNVNTVGIPEADITYFLTKHIAVEAICCVTGPMDIYSHSTKVGSTDIFPPTVLLQYHFDLSEAGYGALKPYIGAGLNYSVFFDDSAATGFSHLKLSNEFGYALQAGFDYHLTGNWFANVDFKKLWLATDWSVIGAAHYSGSVNLDPIIVGAGIGYRFGGYTPLK